MLNVFNKNTIKLNYSCCRNIGSVIASQNRRIVQPTCNNHGCNCSNRAKCLLDCKCLTLNIVYKALVSAPSKPDKKYFGIAETSFKDIQEIFATKNMLTAQNFLNTSEN